MTASNPLMAQGLDRGSDAFSLCLPLGQALAVLLQHLRGGFGGEIRVFELLAGLRDFSLDFLEFPVEAGRFGSGIDLASSGR